MSSVSSPSNKLEHVWLMKYIRSLFIRPDNKILVKNNSDNNIIAILTSDPNERKAEVTSSTEEYSGEISCSELSASFGLKGGVEVSWSNKVLRQEVHVIPKGSEWIFNTDDTGKHYLTIVKADRKDEDASKGYAIIGASSYVPVGYEFIVENDMPVIGGLYVPIILIKKGLMGMMASTDEDEDKHDEVSVKHDEVSVKHDEVPVKHEVPVVKSKPPVNLNMIIGSTLPNTKYKHLFSTDHKVDVVNKRNDAIFVVLSSIPDKGKAVHEGIQLQPGAGTTFRCQTKLNELTVVLMDKGDFKEEGGSFLTLRYKRKIKIGEAWTATNEMLPKKESKSKMEDFL